MHHLSDQSPNFATVTENDRLIIFVRNLEKGRLKNRLAADLGEEQAMNIYHKLLLYTREITKGLNAQKVIYYSESIDNNDLWDNMHFEKRLQQGDNAGERMQNAFAEAFAEGKDRVIIIGSHCLELETYMIKEAFAVLENNDVVLGPAKEGGYYLLGMKKFLPTLFEDKDWSTTDILMDTILDLKKMSAHYYLLKTLSEMPSTDDVKGLNKFTEEKGEDWF